MAWDLKNKENLGEHDGRVVDLELLEDRQSEKHGIMAVASAAGGRLFTVEAWVPEAQFEAVYVAVREQARRRVELGDWTEGDSYRMEF